MRMVSVDRLKPSESESIRSRSHPTRTRRPTVLTGLHAEDIINSLFGNSDSFLKEGFSDMERGPTVFDSMFHPDLFSSSLYDRIRPGRYTRYKPISPFPEERWTRDIRPSTLPSSSVRIIPIKVEHSDRKSPRASPPRQFSSQSPEFPIVIDDCEDVSSKRSAQGHGHVRASTSPNHAYQGKQNTSNKRPVDVATRLSSKISRDNTLESKTLNPAYYLEGGKSNHQKSIPLPVQHLKTQHPLAISRTVNSNNNSFRKQSSVSPPPHISSEATRREVHVDDIDVDLTIPKDTGKLESTNVKSAQEDKDFFDTEQEVNPAPSYPIYEDLKVMLAEENRKVDYIRGDGNCFFRALSKQLYGSERYHKAVRSLIVDIIATNKPKFAQFVDGEDVPKHVERMSEDHCWATTCEIYAAATLLQRDLYMFTPDHLNKNYTWLLFKPIFKSNAANSGVSSHPCYITLCNTNGNHYDRVVPDHGGCNCFAPNPKLEGISDSVDLTT